MNTKNKIKILGPSGVFIVLLVTISLVIFYRVYESREVIDEVATIDIPLIELLTNIETHQLEQSINFERAIRYAEEFDQVATAQQNFENADSLFREQARQVDLELLEAESQVFIALRDAHTDNHRIKLKSLLNSLKKMEKEHESYETHAIVVLNLLVENKVSEAILKADRVEVEEEQFNKQIEGVLMRLELFTEQVVKNAESNEYNTLKWIVMMTCFFVVLSLIATFTFGYKIWEPMQKLRESSERLGSGELTTRVKGEPGGITGELTESFNEMAEKLEKAQEEIKEYTHFSYRTAHDLKAPVANLKGLLAILDGTAVGNEEYSSTMSNIKKSTEQLYMTVTSLNDVISLRETLKNGKEIVSFEETFGEITQSIVQQLEAANATITKDFSQCPSLDYQQIHLKSIMQNLLTNSVKYKSPDRPLHVEIKTEKRMGRSVLIVSDNGLGFDANKHKDKVTNPFTRLHTHVDGSGLGMYIIKTIVDYHQGRVDVDSTPGKGTTFTIVLEGP